MTHAPTDPAIGQYPFVDGSTRTAYTDAGRQYVHDDHGRRVYGTWLLPAEEPDTASIVIARGQG
jgi:hypothetical protein